MFVNFRCYPQPVRVTKDSFVAVSFRPANEYDDFFPGLCLDEQGFVVPVFSPTPTPEETAIDRFYEEIADVQLYLNQIDVNTKAIREMMEQKEARWLGRLRERKNDDGSKVVS